jgi:hypothetical protein
MWPGMRPATGWIFREHQRPPSWPWSNSDRLRRSHVFGIVLKEDGTALSLNTKELTGASRSHVMPI